MINNLTVSIGVTFRSLKYKNFRYFWIGQCISLTGTWMQRTAQVWLVYSITDSPILVGVLGVCQFVPILLFSLFSGVIVDRFPKKRILLITQSLFMLQAVVMTFLTYTGQIRYWHVFILSAVFGIVQTVDMPAKQSFFFELVGKEDVMNAISLNSSIVSLAKIAGPAFSGAVMVMFGPSVCFFINALSFIAVIGGLIKINAEPRAIHSVKQHILHEAAQGLRYIKNSRILIVNVIVMGVVCTFAMNNDVIIPVFSNVVLDRGVSGYTTLLAAAGVGSFIGAIVMAFISKHGVQEKLLIVSALTTALLQISMIFIRQYIICLLLLAVVGFVNMAFLNTANSIFQTQVSNEYRGRVMSVYSLLNQGSTPIGNFFAGTVMEHIGGGSGFFVCGLTALLVLIPVLIVKRGMISEWLAKAPGIH